jgi:hypothetical protein
LVKLLIAIGVEVTEGVDVVTALNLTATGV